VLCQGVYFLQANIGKTKEYTKEQIEQAIQDVTYEALGITRAMLGYQVIHLQLVIM